ncbi:hypothetical protein M7I_6620 [Glarea lozoyensis 74030]|uniref:Uncharacterized protein n=1 Tax=Glarea lozoyensis (strain ATCC 74030 / MF5533) TaxID=1104152 RepID=H0EV27_GLAL7|nr:hypothetical protein M7I_6620 [Glarea lozoyensis 74030]
MQRRLTGMEKAQEKAVEEEVQKYTYYNEKLMQTSYETGDIYNDERFGTAKLAWEISNEGRPYLAHVKALSPLWPPLRLLADFMEIGTSSSRWKRMAGNDDGPSKLKLQLDIEERAARTKVTRLDYLSTGIESVEYTTSQALRESLERDEQEENVEEGRFRLFILEDLSRDMIELLGAHLDIEPGFFREQIFDYAWYNTRDRWVDPPRLQVTTKKQRWMQLRFPAARYYRTPESFRNASNQFERMNVVRKAEDDINNRSKWDEPKAIVGLARTRASFWMSGEGGAGKAKGSVGVLVVDPTPKEGSPLWYGYRNWEKPPSMYDTNPPPTGPPRDSIYNDIVFWAKKSGTFGLSSSNPSESMHTPALALLHLVSSEWLEVGEYIRTRLGQIEWEVIAQTIKWYLAAALPLSIFSLGIAYLFTMPSIKTYFAQFKMGPFKK